MRIALAEFDHLLAERAAFGRQIQSCVPIETATALALTDWIILAGVAMIKLKNLPLSNEPHFINAGMAPIAARGLAYVTVRRGKRTAREAKHFREVADAIGFLAKMRQKGATARRARTILRAWKDTSVVETLFCSTWRLLQFGVVTEQRQIAAGLINPIRRWGPIVGDCRPPKL